MNTPTLFPDRPARPKGAGSVAGVSEANRWNVAINECAPAAAGVRGAHATPAGLRIVVPLLPGSSLRSPPLISLRPAGAEYVKTFVVLRTKFVLINTILKPPMNTYEHGSVLIGVHRRFRFWLPFYCAVKFAASSSDLSRLEGDYV